mgnify:CR=1 FL=1
MTTANLQRRVQRIEARSQPATAGPGYVSFRDDAELRAYLVQPGATSVTAYVTVSPDDWDSEP